MNLGPSRLRYTYDAMMPPQLPPMTCMAMPVPRLRLPPIFPLFQARPSGIWGYIPGIESSDISFSFQAIQAIFSALETERKTASLPITAKTVPVY